ncbi:hypothetical protein [Methanopyrus sp.]
MGLQIGRLLKYGFGSVAGRGCRPKGVRCAEDRELRLETVSWPTRPRCSWSELLDELASYTVRPTSSAELERA